MFESNTKINHDDERLHIERDDQVIINICRGEN